jgi:hypothetical protein
MLSMQNAWSPPNVHSFITEVKLLKILEDRPF